MERTVYNLVKLSSVMNVIECFFLDNHTTENERKRRVAVFVDFVDHNGERYEVVTTWDYINER